MLFRKIKIICLRWYIFFFLSQIMNETHRSLLSFDQSRTNYLKLIHSRRVISKALVCFFFPLREKIFTPAA